MLHTLFIGRKHIHLQEVDSTNNYAAELARQGQALEGTIITASTQLQGKGQRGNAWSSNSNENLLFSVLLLPHFLAITNQFALNKAVALAVCNTLNCFLPHKNAQIKWPNDILVEDRKLAGILVENTIQGGQIGSVVAGIGINIRQKEFDIAGANPTSLLNESKNLLEINEVMHTLCNHLEALYLKLKLKKFTEIESQYTSHLKGLNQLVGVKSNVETYSAILKGVDQQGKVMLEKNDMVKVYAHGDIQLEYLANP